MPCLVIRSGSCDCLPGALKRAGATSFPPQVAHAVAFWQHGFAAGGMQYAWHLSGVMRGFAAAGIMLVTIPPKERYVIHGAT